MAHKLIELCCRCNRIKIGGKFVKPVDNTNIDKLAATHTFCKECYGNELWDIISDFIETHKNENLFTVCKKIETFLGR